MPVTNFGCIIEPRAYRNHFKNAIYFCINYFFHIIYNYIPNLNSKEKKIHKN